jgi:flagellar basal body rod protein FlgC
MNEFDLLNSAAAGMTLQRGLLDLAARNVAAAQASTPNHPYPRLVAQIAEDPSLADDGDDAHDAGALDAPVLVGTHREQASGDALTEMIAVLDAQRAYEANASIFDVGKRLAERTLDIERG